MKRISKLISQGKLLISDGAWGTYLHAPGLKQGDCPELWNIDKKKKVLKIAQSYINAGADMIGTNSFGGNQIKLNYFDLGDRTYDINKAAAEISREATGDENL
ncbi:MAG: homocysteine S-methyltransferase family protein [Bacteroidota bacterium]